MSQKTGPPSSPVPPQKTQSAVIIREMPEAKISDQYRRILAHYVRELEERGVNVLGELKIGRTGRWRFLSDRDPPSYSAAVTIREYLIRKMGIDIPPPTIPVTSVEQYEWAILGQWLFDHDKKEASEILDGLRMIVEAKKAKTALGSGVFPFSGTNQLTAALSVPINGTDDPSSKPKRTKR